jgi:hypothetical protein
LGTNTIPSWPFARLSGQCADGLALAVIFGADFNIAHRQFACRIAASIDTIGPPNLI